jgi:hypothetical protein
MAITATDILWKFSVAAAAGNTTAGTAATSLGDQVSTTQITDATLNNLFDDISGAENAASEAEYRCIFVHNAHATLTLQNATVQVLSQTAGGASADIATDNIGNVAVGSASAQAATVANEDTAPSGVSAFGAGPLSIGDLGPGQVRGVWVRRTAANSAALNPDGAILRVSGDTLP